MLTVTITLAIIASIFGLLLAYSAIRFKVEGDPVVDKIDALLPQISNRIGGLMWELPEGINSPVIEKVDPRFDRAGTHEFLSNLGGTAVEEIHDKAED